jgi:hypothetical protein
MDCKRKVSQVFNNNPQEVDYEDDQNRDGGIMQKQTAVNAKLQTGKTDQTKGLTGRIPSRRRMSALDGTTIEEEEDADDDNDDDPCGHSVPLHRLSCLHSI